MGSPPSAVSCSICSVAHGERSPVGGHEVHRIDLLDNVEILA